VGMIGAGIKATNLLHQTAAPIMAGYENIPG
jgi:hypothetical protein